MTSPSDIMKQVVNYSITNMHTCLPGEIVSYDYTKQKATVQPLLKKRYSDGTIQDLPEITCVPIIFPSGNDFSIHWPLDTGDNVLLLFSERSIDEWLSKGGEVAPLDPRKFDLSDAIAIPGLIPFAETETPHDATSYNLKIGDARVKITPEGGYCFHGKTQELMDIIDQLFTLIENITVIVPPGGSPPAPFPIANSADFVNLQAQFNTLKGDC